MSMRALNKLVGRSIMDPAMLQAFDAGRIEDLIQELDFAPELRKQLCDIQAGSFEEFAARSYVTVSEYEKSPVWIDLPHPAEGLVSSEYTFAIAA